MGKCVMDYRARCSMGKKTWFILTWTFKEKEKCRQTLKWGFDLGFFINMGISPDVPENPSAPGCDFVLVASGDAQDSSSWEVMGWVPATGGNSAF